MNLAAVILAAGYSSRMGEFKPLLLLGGISLLDHCASLLRRAKIRRIVVVTGHCRQETENEAKRLGLVAVHNPDYDAGMFSSVRTGVQQLPKTDGFFLLPVDIPLIRPSTILALSAAFDGRCVVLPKFAEETGHPPLIPHHLIPAILAYKGQNGLQGLLASLKPKETKILPVWDKGVMLDGDTPDDLAVLSEHLTRLAMGERSEAEALAQLLMPEKGLLHGQLVARVAVNLGLELNRHGAALNVDLLYNSGLLHDIAKGRPRHEAAGAKLLKSLGLGSLAEIVSAHRDSLPPESGILSEKEVVYLADKLVRGQYRVPVHQRFTEKLTLYAGNKAACRAIRTRMENALAIQDIMEKSTGKTIEEIIGNGQT
jgi:molybdenum cofactor cytidylyltransferase